MDDWTRFQRLPRIALTALLIAGAAAAMPPGAALATSPTPFDQDRLAEVMREAELEPVARHLSDLGSDDLASRERAMEALLDVEHCADRLLVRALRTFALLPEQRARLIECLRLRFVNGPQNAIGVQMDPVEQGVRVTRVFPQFPAAQALLPNDIITAINGVDISQASDIGNRTQLMTCLILAHDREEMLVLDLIRDGQRLRQRTLVGARADFDQDNPVDPGTLAIAWQHRRRALGVESAPGSSPIVAPVTDRSDWLRSRRRSLQISSGDGIAAGGETSVDPMIVAPLQVAAGPAPRVEIQINQAMPAGPRVIPIPADRDRRDDPRFTGQQAVARMREALYTIRTELERPNLPADRRAELIQTAQGLEMQLQQFEALPRIFRDRTENALRQTVDTEQENVRRLRDALTVRDDLTPAERNVYAEALRLAEMRLAEAEKSLAEAEGDAD